MDDLTTTTIASILVAALTIFLTAFPEVERRVRRLRVQNGPPSQQNTGIFVTLVKEIEDYQNQIAEWKTKFEATDRDFRARLTALEGEVRREKEAREKAEVESARLNSEIVSLRVTIEQQGVTITRLTKSSEDKDAEISKLKKGAGEDGLRITKLEDALDRLNIEKKEAVNRAEVAERERDDALAELRGALKMQDAYLRARAELPEGKESPVDPHKPEAEAAAVAGETKETENGE